MCVCVVGEVVGGGMGWSGSIEGQKARSQVCHPVFLLKFSFSIEHTTMMLSIQNKDSFTCNSSIQTNE